MASKNAVRAVRAAKVEAAVRRISVAIAAPRGVGGQRGSMVGKLARSVVNERLPLAERVTLASEVLARGSNPSWLYRRHRLDAAGITRRVFLRWVSGVSNAAGTDHLNAVVAALRHGCAAQALGYGLSVRQLAERIGVTRPSMQERVRQHYAPAGLAWKNERGEWEVSPTVLLLSRRPFNPQLLERLCERREAVRQLQAEQLRKGRGSRRPGETSVGGEAVEALKARGIRMHPGSAYRWAKRYSEEGIIGLLRERGRPPTRIKAARFT